MNLTLFDLDNTLLPIDSDHAFGEFMISMGWADADAFRQRNGEFYAQYQAEALDVAAYVAFKLRDKRKPTKGKDDTLDSKGAREPIFLKRYLPATSATVITQPDELS